VPAVGLRAQQDHDRPWQPDGPYADRLVMIGEKGRDQAAIAAALSG